MELSLEQPKPEQLQVLRIQDGAIFLDKEWRYVYLNEAAAELFMIRLEDVKGQNIWDEPSSEERIAFRPQYEACMRERVQYVTEEYYSWCDRWYENRIYPFRDGIVILFIDITERRKQQRDLRDREKSGSVMLSSLPGMAYSASCDDEWRLSFVSEGCRELTGYAEEKFMGGLRYIDIVSPEYRKHLKDAWAQAALHKKKVNIEYVIVKAGGERIWVNEIGRYVPCENGGRGIMTSMVVDIHARKTRELEAEYLLNHDYLSGLFNRIYYEKELKRLDTSGKLPFSIMIGDINGLKMMNDALGHGAGDQVIKDTANLLKKCCRPEDIIGRIGGDEFAILLPGADLDVTEQVFRKFKSAIEEHNKTYSNDLMKINLSLGYATKDLPDISVDSVSMLAEENMYKRKLTVRKSLHSSIVESIKTTLTVRSQETEDHAERITKLVVKMGTELALSQMDLNDLELFAALHDIGKVGVSDKILNKPGSLTPEEWAEMRKHSEIGYRIAMASADLMCVADYILSHHERWDGKGYPQGLSGRNIPAAARILAVADSYDAMTQNRVYRKAMSKEAAVREIRKNRGTQFDPMVVDAFLKLQNEIQ